MFSWNAGGGGYNCGCIDGLVVACAAAVIVLPSDSPATCFEYVLVLHESAKLTAY